MAQSIFSRVLYSARHLLLLECVSPAVQQSNYEDYFDWH